jgi:hypothetical protein
MNNNHSTAGRGSAGGNTSAGGTTGGANFSSKGKGDMAPPPIPAASRRSTTAAGGTGYESDPGRGPHSRSMSMGLPGVTGAPNAKGWGFEFLDHPPPSESSRGGYSSENDAQREIQSTHADFNKMLVRG